jgi:hypothetical protein
VVVCGIDVGNPDGEVVLKLECDFDSFVSPVLSSFFD